MTNSNPSGSAPVLVITGAQGSGKSSVADRLCSLMPRRFARARAATTRPPRPGELEYHFVNESAFQSMVDRDELLTNVRYADARYGIERASFQSAIDQGRTPILVLTPDSALDFHPSPEAELPILAVFLDATDEALDHRLEQRAQALAREPHSGVGTAPGMPSDEARRRRQQDRLRRTEFSYVISEGNTDERAQLIDLLVSLQSGGRCGILPKHCIDRMIRCGMLLEDASDEKTQPASYDLRLGDEYFYAGRIHRLSAEEPILVVDPYDYAIVTTRERANLPRDVAARFDLSVSLFAQGVVLSNGPQVDPGFRGPLFCLLFNTSSSQVLLKRGQHYATIEFHRLFEPTEPYRGPYQDKQLLDYLPANAARGAINELKRELQLVREQIQAQQFWIWSMLSLILALVAIYAALK